MNTPGRASAAQLFIVLFAALCLVSAFRDIDHDEGQYVAAVALMRTGLPYRDFAYLQTPLQPLLFAPLAWACEGWLFPALRAMNALCAAGAAVLLFSAVRRAGGANLGAYMAALGLVSCHAFLFAATVARNDAMPLFLSMGGLWLVIVAIHGSSRTRSLLLLAAGVALGAAASAKISYALPAAAVGIFALLHPRHLGFSSVSALAAGGIIGLLPTVALWWIAPDAAWFGIIEYSLAAPFEWRSLNGQSYMLEWPLSIGRMLLFLAQGPGLLVLALIVWTHLRKPATRRDPARGSLVRMLDFMIVAGLFAAWLPRPIYVQYLGPLLPALLLRLGLMLGEKSLPSWVGYVAVPASMLIGIAETAIRIVPNLVRGRSPTLSVIIDAHAMGREYRDAGMSGPIATLAPERVVDSEIALDPQFAAGPFLFRTQSLLNLQQQEALHATTMTSAATYLSRRRPSAILLGVETKPTVIAPKGLEQPLLEWSITNGYRVVPLPSGLSLYLAK